MKCSLVALAWLCGLAACASDEAESDVDEQFSGGAHGTVFDTTRMAFAQALPVLTGAREDQFFVGNSIFNRAWATAPASVADFDGLGPLFNATNCSACHLKDGRGQPPELAGEPFTSMLVRLSVPGSDAQGGPLAEPSYGGQLQDNAVLGVAREGLPRVQYSERPGAFADGEPYSLRQPSYSFDALAYGALAADVMISPRVAPAVFGLGLLAALPDATLEKLADPDDRDHDGISGRINHVWDVRRGGPAIGRFGWKANQPTIEQQTAGAFEGDIGITSTLFRNQGCSGVAVDCNAAPSGAEPGGVELSDAILSSVVSYMHTLAVPARRDVDAPQVRRGKKLFKNAGCEGCHVATLETGDVTDFPELSRQLIHPYTDLLLHDMGPELADGRPDFEATGQEWRTPPLWGIGLVKTVNRHTYFLHDGRARGLLEAVLFHGGEAEAAREAVLKLSRDERAALLAFLESL